jgi:hypothetical protein
MRNTLGLIFAIIAAPAIAAADPSAPGDPVADGEKIICKGKPSTGTRFATRKCMTKAEWEAMSEQHTRAAKEMFSKPTINPPEEAIRR